MTAHKDNPRSHASRPRLLDRLESARANTDGLFRIVLPDALYDRPIPERHRIVFYIGHLEAFDWNLLSGRAFGLKPFRPEFDKLFAFGIDPVDGSLPSDRPSDWPSLNEIAIYNRRIRKELDERLASESSDELQVQTDILLNVAIEHRLMHSETLAYMFNQLPLSRLVPVPFQNELSAAKFNSDRMVDIPAGEISLGLPRKNDVFGWDNEFEEHRVDLPSFSIDESMVSNGNFLGFIKTGGYELREFWDEAGWNWIQKEGIRRPKLWMERDGNWFYRAMFDEVPLPLEWPVYVSHAEAAAYARWAGKQLPTEAQWQRAAYGTPQATESPYPWGEEEPDASRGVFDFSQWDPAPVNLRPAGRSAFGINGMLGNGWEWTSTSFDPFPGFEPFPFYSGYSANFFDGEHYVMKGGSARTAACMLRSSFRNWFQPHYQYAYAGFRCVAN